MFVADAHNDFLIQKNSEEAVSDYVVNDLVPNHVNTVLAASFVNDSQLNLQDSRTILDKIKNNFQLVSKFSELIPTLENCGYITNEKILEEIINLKPFAATLTWNGQNCLGGGADTHAGLTDLGKEVVKELERNNITIDTAHMSRESFFDFYNITTRPVFNSHSCCCNVFQHKRNLDDLQLEAVIETRGFLGICFYSGMLTDREQSSIKDIVKHMNYIAEKWGTACIGLGSDFFGTDGKQPHELAGDYFDIYKLIDSLKECGWGSAQIEEVMSKNLNAYIKKANYATL